jgi:excisionase family DNA binding protein
MTTNEVAERFATSTRTVRRYVAAGELPAIRLRGGLRFEPQDVAAFIAAARTRRRA